MSDSGQGQGTYTIFNHTKLTNQVPELAAYSPTEPVSLQIQAPGEDALKPCEAGYVCMSGSMWNKANTSSEDPALSNLTTATDGQYHWEVLGLLPIMLFGIAGNILVCMAVSMEKRLQSVTNYFLLSLAVTDLLLCIIVMPFSIIHEFLGYWPFNYILCDMFVTSDVLMCTASILHLCTISLERFLAIRSPLALRNRSNHIVVLKIILVWALALAITSPITILGLVDHSNILNDKKCALTNVDFILYGSTAAFFIPLGIMVISYGLTIKLLHQQTSRCNSGLGNEDQPIMRRSISRRGKFKKHVKFTPRRTKSCPSSGARERHSFSGTGVTRYSVKSCLNVPLQEPEMTPPPSPLPYQNHGPDLDSIEEENRKELDWRNDSMSSSEESPRRLKSLVRKHQLVLKAANILLLRKETMESEQQRTRQQHDDVKTERKASKTLGVVFVIFIICWAPFFIVNIMTVLCLNCTFQPLLITSFVWLGYVSSTLNPIIYTTFNKTFKMTFIKLLKCQYGSIQKSFRVRWNSRNGYQNTFRTTSTYMHSDCNESAL